MQIPLAKAISLLQNAAGIIVDDDIIMYPSVDADPKAIHFMELRWDVEGLCYAADFARADHETVEAENDKLILRATDDAVFEITLLEASRIPEEPQVGIEPQVGKLYKTRDGRIAWVCGSRELARYPLAGLVVIPPDKLSEVAASKGLSGTWSSVSGATTETWTATGRAYDDDRTYDNDIVEEYDGPFPFPLPANCRQPDIARKEQEPAAVITPQVGELYNTRAGHVAWIWRRIADTSYPFEGVIVDPNGAETESWTASGSAGEYSGTYQTDLVSVYDGPFPFPLPTNYQPKTTTTKP